MAEYFKQSFIEKVTNEIREACGYSESELIDMEKVVEKIEFTLTRYEDKPNINGKVLNSKDEKIIYVNTKSDRPERFTIAHEIGHIVLHHKDFNGTEPIIDYRTEDNKYNPKEFQANMFASAFLMPKNESIKVWDLVKDIDMFAELFDVSKRSAEIRLSILKLL